MVSKFSIVSLLASIVAAQDFLADGKTSVNPTITPGVEEIVAACKPYEIRWTPNTAGPVSIQLLIGDNPQTLAKGDFLTASTANTGSFTYTFPATLAGTPAGRGYGFQIVDIPTGKLQYSPQFGLNKAACGASSSSAAVSSLKPASSTANGGYPVSSTLVKSSSAVAPSSSPCSTVVAPPKTTPVYPTAGPSGGSPPSGGNSTVAQPTGPSGPVSYPTGTTTVKPPQITGAASALQAGVGLVGAVAAFALML